MLSRLRLWLARLLLPSGWAMWKSHGGGGWMARSGVCAPPDYTIWFSGPNTAEMWPPYQPRDGDAPEDPK